MFFFFPSIAAKQWLVVRKGVRKEDPEEPGLHPRGGWTGCGKGQAQPSVAAVGTETL